MTSTTLRAVTAFAAAAVMTASAATAQDEVDRSDWPDAVTVGTASQGGTYFTYGSGWAALVQEMVGINTNAEVTGGPVTNASLIQTGDLEFGMVTMGPAYEAWIGMSPLAPGLPHDRLRAMFPMYQTPFQIITLADSGIDSVEGLQGRVVGVGPAGGTSGTYFPRFFDSLGVEVEIRNGGASDMAGQLQDGIIDAFAFSAGIPISAFSQIEAQVGANIFSFSDEQIAALLEEYPSVGPFNIPADTYQSTEADVATIAMWNFAVASADMPASLVHEIMVTVLDNNDRMMEIHRAARETLSENYVHNSFLPFHPGAVQYLEEQGFDVPDDLEG